MTGPEDLSFAFVDRDMITETEANTFSVTEKGRLFFQHSQILINLLDH